MRPILKQWLELRRKLVEEERYDELVNQCYVRLSPELIKLIWEAHDGDTSWLSQDTNAKYLQRKFDLHIKQLKPYVLWTRMINLKWDYAGLLKGELFYCVVFNNEIFFSDVYNFRVDVVTDKFENVLDKCIAELVHDLEEKITI